MLYNPNWNDQAKRDIWSLDSFIAWLETLNPAGTYYYGSSRECLIAQYLEACGMERVVVGVRTASYFDPNKKQSWLSRLFYGMRRNESAPLPPGWDAIAMFNWTFAGALNDAKALRAVHNISEQEPSPQDHLAVSFGLLGSTA